MAVKAYPGKWEEVARAVAPADVVVCHHVFYNVPDLATFATNLTSHARQRVVVELSGRHPVAGTNPRRLCLPPERQPDVEEALARWPEPAEREAVTLTWPGRAK